MGRKIWDNLEEYALIGSFFFVVPLLFMQIIMRYVFQNSLTWSEELARYIFLWQIWVGAGYAVKKNRHIRIEVIKGKLSKKKSFYLEILVTIIWILFTSFLLWKSGGLTAKIFRLNQTSPALHLPMGIPYLSVPVGCILMLLHLIEHIVGVAKQISACGEAEGGN